MSSLSSEYPPKTKGVAIFFATRREAIDFERQPLAVRPLNEIYATESCLELIASERIDGKLVRAEAVKLFKLKNNV